MREPALRIAELGVVWVVGELLSAVPRGSLIMSKAFKNKFSWLISGPEIINIIRIFSSVCRPVDFP